MTPIPLLLAAILAGQGDAEAIRAADLALGRAVAAHDAIAFKALIHPQAIFFGARQAARGPEAVAEAWTAFLSPGGPTLTWKPETVEVAASGDLGYSIGPYQLGGVDKDGKPLAGGGSYVSIWRKGADGAWRIAVDIGTPPSPPPGSPPAAAATAPPAGQGRARKRQGGAQER